MKAYIAYDSGIRHVISVIFRALLFINGGAIIFTTKNALPYQFYLVEFCLFPAFFYLFFGKEGIPSKLRLLNDFIFIGVVLYGKELNSIVNAVFLFLPIINSPNHSGARRSQLVYILTICVILVSDKNTFSYWYLLPVAILWMLSWFEQLRFSLNILTSNLMTIIDRYDVNNYQFGNTHRIYRELIKQINASKLSRWFEVEKIICYLVGDKKRLNLYNSSVLISNYKINLSEKQLSNLKNGELIKDINIELNGLNNTSNFFISVKIASADDDTTKDRYYLFCFTVNKKNVIFYTIFNHLIVSYLIPGLVKIARLISMETTLRLLRDSELLRIKNKLGYVNNALLAMHFIRNKLSPIQNAIKMSLDEPQLDSDEKIKEWQKLKSKDLRTSEVSIQAIREKADYILENENNPFKIKEVYAISFSKVFFLIRRIWLNYFESASIDIRLTQEVMQSTNFLLNDEAIEIVFTDIINNASKYCNDKTKSRLLFYEENEAIVIEFINDLKSRSIDTELITLAENFNTKEFSYINRRTHGLKIVKEFLDQMRVVYKMEIFEGEFMFRLILNRKK